MALCGWCGLWRACCDAYLYQPLQAAQRLRVDFCQRYQKRMEANKEPDMTPSDLFCMAMSDNTAGDHMHELCRLLGTPYPPRVDDFTELTKENNEHLQIANAHYLILVIQINICEVLHHDQLFVLLVLLVFQPLEHQQKQ